MDKDIINVGYTIAEILDAKMEEWDYETFASAGNSLVAVRDKSFWLLGKMVDKAIEKKEWGKGIVVELSKEWGVESKTLYEYRHVYTTLGETLIRESENLPYTVLREAAKTNEPIEWIKKADAENLTPLQLHREIKLANVQKVPTHNHEWKELHYRACTVCGLREDL